jgi:hypothetical protein
LGYGGEEGSLTPVPSPYYWRGEQMARLVEHEEQGTPTSKFTPIGDAKFFSELSTNIRL